MLIIWLLKILSTSDSEANWVVSSTAVLSSQLIRHCYQDSSALIYLFYDVLIIVLRKHQLACT
jgi:hypothetical protein